MSRNLHDRGKEVGIDKSHDDIICLRDLRVLAFCGVLPAEVRRAQPFSINLDVHVDLSLASLSDDLADTVDYGEICSGVARIAEEQRFALLERFAGCIADEVLAIPCVNGVDVEIQKLRPPVAEMLGTSGVRISRWL